MNYFIEGIQGGRKEYSGGETCRKAAGIPGIS